MSAGRPTLDQRRARHAWKAVERACGLHDAADYARETKRLPVRIRTSGLGQALAFVNAKAGSEKERGKNARIVLLEDLGDWLLVRRRLAAVPAGGVERKSVMTMIVDGDAGLLRRATEEALLYLQWLTRFCEAEIGDDEDR